MPSVQTTSYLAQPGIKYGLHLSDPDNNFGATSGLYVNAGGVSVDARNQRRVRRRHGIHCWHGSNKPCCCDHHGRRFVRALRGANLSGQFQS